MPVLATPVAPSVTELVLLFLSPVKLPSSPDILRFAVVIWDTAENILEDFSVNCVIVTVRKDSRDLECLHKKDVGMGIIRSNICSLRTSG